MPPLSSAESFVFWQHVRLGGFAPGPTDTTATNYLPKTPLEEHWGLPMQGTHRSQG